MEICAVELRKTCLRLITMVVSPRMWVDFRHKTRLLSLSDIVRCVVSC